MMSEKSFMKHIDGSKAINRKTLIFSDLDGTLLDHHNYSSTPVQPCLAELEGQGIPVIFCSSKTCAELLPLRTELNNRHPFIIENGAAVYIPHGYFTQPPLTQALDDKGQYNAININQQAGYSVYAFTEPRSHWQQLIDSVAEHYQDNEFTSFAQMTLDDLIAATGLNSQAANRAQQRSFGEPILWRGEGTRKKHFIDDLSKLGATILEGGRFLHVSGATDKGRALQWLAACYRQQQTTHIETIAAGDGNNDIAMLEAADKALIIRSPANPPPKLHRTENVWQSTLYGPEGWAATMPLLIPTLQQPTFNH